MAKKTTSARWRYRMNPSRQCCDTILLVTFLLQPSIGQAVYHGSFSVSSLPCHASPVVFVFPPYFNLTQNVKKTEQTSQHQLEWAMDRMMRLVFRISSTSFPIHTRVGNTTDTKRRISVNLGTCCLPRRREWLLHSQLLKESTVAILALLCGDF